MKQKLMYQAVSLALAVAYAPLVSAQEAKTEAGDVQTVTVTGFRSSLEKAIGLKQSAIGIRDSIVAEDIGKFPEANVAESLQRIPGVYLSRDGSSNEGRQISIRGLGPQYSVTTINGMPVHTTSGDSAGSSVRSFNYDVFASELFGRVDFYKSPMADLDEGGIGGVVDLQTPRPFDKKGRTFTYQLSESFNDASRKWNPRGSFIASNTWGNFGALVGFAHNGSNNARSGFQSTGSYNTPALGRNNAPSGYNVPFNFDLDYNDPRANLGNLTRQQVDNALLPRFYRVYGNLDRRTRDGLVTSFQYKDSKWDVSLDSLFSRLKDRRDEYTFGLAIRNSRTTNTAAAPGTAGHNGLVPINVFIDRNNQLQGTFGNTSYISEGYIYDSGTDFKMHTLSAKYTVSPDLKVTGSVGRSSSTAYFTNDRIFMNIYGVTSTIDSSQNREYPVLTSAADYNDRSLYKDPALGYNYKDENDYSTTAKLGLDWRYGLPGGWTGRLHTGLTYNSAKKEKASFIPTAVGQAMQLPIGGSVASLGNSITKYMSVGSPIANFASGAPATFPTSWAYFDRSFIEDVLNPIKAKLASPLDTSSTFTTKEDVSSLFIASDFTGEVFGRELRLNAGVRYARTKTKIHNYTQVLQDGVRSFVPNSSSASYGNVLPSLSAAYDVTPDFIARASIGRTITRAALSDIAANTVIPNPFNQAATAGNPELKPQVSDQVDLTGEWYPAKGAMLSAGLFYKKMKDMTMTRSVVVPFSSLGLPDTALGTNLYDPATGRPSPDLPITVSTVYNGGTQNLKGFELAYQQAFTFLPEPWNGLGAIASFTRVKWPTPDYITADSGHHTSWEVPRYTYSLTAYYERGPWALRTSYNFKDGYTGDRSGGTSTINLTGLQSWVAPRSFLDASISYKLSESLELRLDGMNLQNRVSYSYLKDTMGHNWGDDNSRVDNLLYDGRTIQLGLRGKF